MTAIQNALACMCVCSFNFAAIGKYFAYNPIIPREFIPNSSQILIAPPRLIPISPGRIMNLPAEKAPEELSNLIHNADQRSPGRFDRRLKYLTCHDFWDNSK